MGDEGITGVRSVRACGLLKDLRLIIIYIIGTVVGVGGFFHCLKFQALIVKKS